MPLLICDSEDEQMDMLESVIHSSNRTPDEGAPGETHLTATGAHMMPSDAPSLFDIESTFIEQDGSAAGRSKTSKRRQTEGFDDGRALKKKKTDRSRRSQSDVSRIPGDLALQNAREDVLLQSSRDSIASANRPDGTARFGTAEYEEALKLARAAQGVSPNTPSEKQSSTELHEAIHDPDVQVRPCADGSSGSVPWSVGTIRETQTPSTNPSKRARSTQSDRSSRLEKTTTTDLRHDTGEINHSPQPDKNPLQAITRAGQTRSGDVNVIPTDWSKAPEKLVTKGRSKSRDQHGHATEVIFELAERAQQARDADSSGGKEGSVWRAASPDQGNITVQVSSAASEQEECATSAGEIREASQTRAKIATSDVIDRAGNAPCVDLDQSMASQTTETQNNIVMGPPTSSVSASKRKARSKRSHTTIFEDHVGFGQEPSSELEPVGNLKQQQATRKKRGRPKKVIDQAVQPAEATRSDEEKAHVMAGAPVAADESNALSSQSKECPNDQQDINTTVPAAQTAAQPISPKLPDTAEVACTETSREEAEPQSRPSGNEENLAIDVMREITKLDTASKRSHAVHSPIKKTSGRFRVGLSKFQRIQPLLRVMRK